jgi:hypothetical protein
MADIRFISADSHMTEPGDLWAERLDHKYRDNAPRVVKNEKSDRDRVRHWFSSAPAFIHSRSQPCSRPAAVGKNCAST